MRLQGWVGLQQGAGWEAVIRLSRRSLGPLKTIQFYLTSGIALFDQC